MFKHSRYCAAFAAAVSGTAVLSGRTPIRPGQSTEAVTAEDVEAALQKPRGR